MTKEETIALFIAICGDDRTKFNSYPIGMARVENLRRAATIRTPLGDELTVWLTNYPGGCTLRKVDDDGYFDITHDEWEQCKNAFERGTGVRAKAKVEDVLKMLAR